MLWCSMGGLVDVIRDMGVHRHVHSVNHYIMEICSWLLYFVFSPTCTHITDAVQHPNCALYKWCSAKKGDNSIQFQI